jgi:hypothetical protein
MTRYHWKVAFYLFANKGNMNWYVQLKLSQGQPPPDTSIKGRLKSLRDAQMALFSILGKTMWGLLKKHLALANRAAMMLMGGYSWTMEDTRELLFLIFDDGVKIPATAFTYGLIPIPVPKIWSYYVMWRQGKNLFTPQNPAEQKPLFDEFLERFVLPSTFGKAKSDYLHDHQLPVQQTPSPSLAQDFLSHKLYSFCAQNALIMSA